MTGRVVAIADLVVDLVATVSLPVLPARHQHVPYLRLEPGGASNFMITGRRLGLDIASVGTVGDDGFGAAMLDALASEGIDTAGIEVTPGATTSAVFVLTDTEKGEHVFIGHYGEGPAAPYGPAMDAAVRAAGAVFVFGYTLNETRSYPLMRAAIERAVTLGIPVYFDPGPTIAGVPPADIAWVVARSDVMLLTDDELPLVAPGLAAEDACAALLAAGPGTLVVKHGPRGCTVMRPDGREDVPGFPVPVVDTVGAGDCFAAAFLAGRLAGLSLHDAALLANATGAACVQKVGAGRNAPTCAEVQAVLRQADTRIPFSC